MNRLCWDDYFMVAALWLSRRSPDPSTKHGAIFVDAHHRPLSFGYNGYPRGSNDDAMPKTRPDKYYLTIHAEHNAIINADTKLLEGSTLYVTGPPCTRCWAQLLQVGVRRVVIGPVASAMLDTKEAEMTSLLLEGRDIEIVQWQGDLQTIAKHLEWIRETLEMGE